MILDKKESGMKIIAVDPRVTPFTVLADYHLQLKPGTDGALALGMANVIVSEGLYDKEFIEKYAHGFQEYREYIKEYTPEKTEEITGVPKDKIIGAARLYAGTKPAALMPSSAPVVHQTNGLQNYRAVMLLVALTGNVDVKGGNVFKESSFLENACGYHTRQNEYQEPPVPFSEMPPRLGFDRFPIWMRFTNDAHGGMLRQQIITEKPYPITHMLAFGINHRMWPDTLYTIEALKKLEFFVDVDIFMTDTCKYADIVLPACTSLERSELKAYGNGYTIFTKPVIEPLYESKPDTDIIFELAKRIAGDDELMREGYEKSLDWIFEPSGMTVEELKNQPLGMMAPQVPYEFKKYEREGFPTLTGKVEFTSEMIRELQPSQSPLPKYEPPRNSREARPDLAKEYPFVLNTGTRLPMYHHSRTFRLPWIQALRPLPTVDINREDAEALNISQGDMIAISTPKAQIKLKANISEMGQKGVVYIFHDYKDADANTLIDAEYLDPISGFTGFKSLLCKVEKAGEQ